jgi:hypothetical protein
MRHFSPRFAKNHGNALEAARNSWGRATHGWDSERGQSNYDSQMQMQDASRKYQSDVETTKKAASDWAKKGGKSPAEQQAEYFKRLAEIEKNWSRQYAANLSTTGFAEHEKRRRDAQQKMKDAEKKVLDESLRARYGEQKPAQISNQDKQRGFIQKWLRERVKAGEMTLGQTKTYLADWDKEQAAARGEAPKTKPLAWNAETRQIAQNFGLPTGSVGEEEFDGSNTLTLKIPPRRADDAHRAARYSNTMPRNRL